MLHKKYIKMFLFMLFLAPMVMLGGQTVDNLIFEGNSIKSLDTNGNVVLDPNGTGGVEFTDLDATTVPYLDGNKELTSSSVTPTELGYLSGATSSLQTQLDGLDTNGVTQSGSATDNAIPVYTGTDNEVEETSVFITPGATNGQMTLNGNNGYIRLSNQNGVRFGDDDTNYAEIIAPSNLTGNYTLTLPGADGTDGQALITDGSGALSFGNVASDGGGGSKNYFNPDSAELETDTGGWATDDGTGIASSTLSISRTTTANLAGVGSLYVEKSGSNADGEFVKLASETVDVIDRGNPLFGSFSFSTGGSYASGDLVVQLWDNTNDAELYAGIAENLEIADATGKFHFVVYPENDTEEIELRLVVNNTNTNTFIASFDEFKLGPAASVQTVYRKSATIDLTGSGDFTAGEIQVERVGNQVTVMQTTAFTFSSTSDASSAVALLPEWARPETRKYNPSFFSAAGNYLEEMYIDEDGTVGVFFANFSGVVTSRTSTQNFGTISYTVPEVQGPTMTDNELSLQTFRYKAYMSSAYTPGSLATIAYDTVSYDPFGAKSGNNVKIPRSGYYRVYAVLRDNVNNINHLSQMSVFGGASGTTSIYTKKLDESSNTALTYSKDIYYEGYFEKDELVNIRYSNSQSTGAIAGEGNSFFTVSAIPDFIVIGAVRNPGEYLESNFTTVTNLNTTYTDISGSSLELTAGEWIVGFEALVFNNTGTTADVITSIYTNLWYADNTAIGNTTAKIYSRTAGNAHDDGNWVSNRTKIVLTETKTIKMRGYKSVSTNTVQVGAGDAIGKVWAQRLK